MAVDVGHLLVHECGVGILLLRNKETGIRSVQIVGDGAFAQRLRVAVLVGPFTGIEKLACLRVVHVQLATHE